MDSVRMGNGEGKRGGLLHGVAWLTVAGLAAKVLGFLYKVPLNAILGDEMANVNAAYAVYAVLYTVSTAGIPSAVSLSVSSARAAGDVGRVRAVFRVTMTALLAVGAVLTVLLLLFARPLSVLNSGGDSYSCMLAIAPALFFSASVSVLRGFFQGFQDMKPTAVSEIIEAVCKTVFGVLLALASLRLFSWSARTAAALSVLGITLGVALAAGYLSFVYFRADALLPTAAPSAHPLPSNRRLFGAMLGVALPIALTSAMMNLSTLADAQLMRPLLTRFLGDAELAKAIYADYSTGAVTLTNMPSVFIYPISAAIVPYISAALSRGERGRVVKTVEGALAASAAISLPCALGMSALASPLLSLVFHGDIDMAAHAGGLLSVLAVSVFFAAILTVCNAVLQAVGRERLPILAVVPGVAVKVVSMWLLCRRFGAVGVPVSTLLFYMTVTAFDLCFVGKQVGITGMALGRLLRPLPSALLSSFTALGLYRLTAFRLGSVLATLLAVLAAVSVYATAALLLGVIGEEELALFPFGRRLCRLLPRTRVRHAPHKG